MVAGATNMAEVRARGVQACGIAPARSLAEKTGGHGARGDNERAAAP